MFKTSETTVLYDLMELLHCYRNLQQAEKMKQNVTFYIYIYIYIYN